MIGCPNVFFPNPFASDRETHKHTDHPEVGTNNFPLIPKDSYGFNVADDIYGFNDGIFDLFYCGAWIS